MPPAPPPEPRAGQPGPPLIILDMDGVLLHLDLDTERVRAQIARAFAEVGIEQPFRPLIASIDQACARLEARDPGLAARLRQQAWHIIDEEELRAAPRCRPAPGLAALCRALAAYPVALFTNNSLPAVSLALRRAGIPEDLFLAIQARPGPGSIKPAAEPVLALIDAAARHTGAMPGRVFLIGDQPADMQSADAARARLQARGWTGSMVPVAVRGPWRSDRELEDAGAWFIAADLAEAVLLATTRPVPTSLSIVLLALNEEASIEHAIVDARRFCRLYFDDYQIVVVDDGCTDRTAAMAERTGAAHGDVTLVRHPVNQGMGASMRDGYLAATMEYIAHLPADRQVRPQALAAFLPHLAPERVVVSHYAAPPSGEARQWLSRAFRLLTQTIGGLTVDFAGTYTFHRDWRTAVDLRALVSDTFLFSFELLERLARAGASFTRVQIHNFPREIGTSREARLARMSRVLREIVRYRVRSALRTRRG